uniref:Uncharacterized protein n=1 Tax=Anguilla anguilla TaxID=7936 RepID=A0A0E9P8F7_ANGAN
MNECSPLHSHFNSLLPSAGLVMECRRRFTFSIRVCKPYLQES